MESKLNDSECGTFAVLKKAIQRERGASDTSFSVTDGNNAGNAPIPTDTHLQKEEDETATEHQNYS